MISKYLGIESDYIIDYKYCSDEKTEKELSYFYERKRCEDIGRYIDSKARSG